MPEGPSLILARENLVAFVNKRVKEVAGNARVDLHLLKGRTIKEFRTWGKQLFIFFDKPPVVRVHFLMFGSYSIDEHFRPDKSVRLCLTVGKHKIYFYTCSVKFVDDPGPAYDWAADVMSDAFSVSAARKKLKKLPDLLVCDALLNQDIFAGVGNIIKNEVLFRIKLHPESLTGKVPRAILTKLIKEARNYCFDFLEWKRNFELKKHWLAHTKKECPRCHIPLLKKYCGKTKRRTFYCENCQVKYE